jgi:hypothetical protein
MNDSLTMFIHAELPNHNADFNCLLCFDLVLLFVSALIQCHKLLPTQKHLTRKCDTCMITISLNSQDPSSETGFLQGCPTPADVQEAAPLLFFVASFFQQVSTGGGDYDGTFPASSMPVIHSLKGAVHGIASHVIVSQN